MNIKQSLNRHSPTILTSLGLIGFATTVVMAVKATPRAMKVLDNKKEKTNYEKAKSLFPIYSPSIGMGLISAGAIVGAQKIQADRFGAIMALYSISERSLSRFQDAVLSEMGEKKYDSVRLRSIEPTEEPGEEPLGSGDTLCYDSFTGRYFKVRSVEDIRRVVNDINDVLYSEDWVALNEYYLGLGMDRVEFGDLTGWHVSNGQVKIRLDSMLTPNSKPAVVVSFVKIPKLDWH